MRCAGLDWRCVLRLERDVAEFDASPWPFQGMTWRTCTCHRVRRRALRLPGPGALYPASGWGRRTAALSGHPQQCDRRDHGRPCAGDAGVSVCGGMGAWRHGRRWRRIAVLAGGPGAAIRARGRRHARRLGAGGGATLAQHDGVRGGERLMGLGHGAVRRRNGWHRRSTLALVDFV